MSENILIGSYCQQNNPGIYINQESIKSYNPSYLLLRPPYLYAVQQTDNGQIVCYDFNGKYQIVKILPTLGKSPCHISIDNTGRFLFVTNYSSSSIAQYFLNNGKLQLLVDFIIHQGSSIDPDRQQIAHPHSSLASHDNKIYFICDLGNDILYYYDFNQELGKVKYNQQKSIKLTGYGPRHASLGAQKDKLLFLSCELNSKVVILSYQNKLTKLYQIETNQTTTIRNYPSQIKYFFMGTDQYIIVANRGDNNIILYKLANKDKNISLNQLTIQSVYNWPRHFNLNKDNSKILVACQNGSIVSQYSFIKEQIKQLRKIAITTPSYVSYF